jgi:hypothetical protein
MPEIQDKSYCPNIPGDERDGLAIVIEDYDRAVADGCYIAEPKEEIAYPQRCGMERMLHGY